MTIRLPFSWAALAEVRRRHGLSAMIQRVASRLATRLLCLEVVEMVWLDVADLPMSLVPDPQFECRFLTPAEVARFAQDSVNEIEPEFVRRAEVGRDRCFAILDGERLAAYGWYALRSIEPEHSYGVGMSYPDDVAYMYKGLTMPDYRGRRLHGIGMALALRELAASGVARLISTVEWTNWGSLRSCQRLGYRRLGRLWVFRCRRFCRFRAPRAAHQRGVRFGPDATVESR